MPTKCFFVTQTDRYVISLRRYKNSSSINECPAHGYHNADGPVLTEVTGTYNKAEDAWEDPTKGLDVRHDDPRWPVKCDHCDYLFTEQDEYQLFADHVYLDAQGKERSLYENVEGMMWYADWYGDYDKGPDGHSLVVVCPGGHQWVIDSQASNCDQKQDVGPYGVAHRCWNRTGEPPNITVGKGPGKTCGAGGGSIQTPNYHGFLQNGEFNP